MKKKISVLLVALIAGAIVFFEGSYSFSDIEEYIPSGSEIKDTIDEFVNGNSDLNHSNVQYINLDSIPVYSGNAYAVVNENVPFFTDEDKNLSVFEEYAPLDSLGRAGVAFAKIDQSLMPTEDRESISSVKPSGWQSIEYDIVSGKYLYNRAHLIGFQLTGENANEENLITGTRSFNVDGMLPFENMVADYIKETNNPVIYRVTPIYNGDNLVASGVLMEALSIVDDSISFCVYIYNNEPGIKINYADGTSSLE